VRRLVQARDDPAKQRIRRWLSDINDERLLSFGLTPEDIALLRGSRGSGNFAYLLLMCARSVLPHPVHSFRALQFDKPPSNCLMLSGSDAPRCRTA
jgi:hypothetical protein